MFTPNIINVCFNITPNFTHNICSILWWAGPINLAGCTLVTFALAIIPSKL